MAEAATAGPERSRLTGAHLLKLAAVAALMLYHYTYRDAALGETSIPPLQAIARQGFIGIDVFLMVSGFTILGSARGRSAAEFVRERVLRRFPEFWIAVLVSGLIFHFAPIHDGRIPTLGTVLANLSMVPQLLGFPMVDALYEILFEELRFSFVVWAVVLLGLFKRIELLLFAIIALSLAGTVTHLPLAIRALIDFPVGPLFAVGGLLAIVHESGWTPARTAALVLGVATSCSFALRESASYVDPAHITTVESITTVVLLAGSCLLMATLGPRAITIGPLGPVRYAPVLCGLAYPLLLLESTGKAIFLKGLVPGPRPLLLLCAITFSTLAALAVMKLGTGPLRRSLGSLIDRFGPPFHRGPGPAPRGTAHE